MRIKVLLALSIIFILTRFAFSAPITIGDPLISRAAKDTGARAYVSLEGFGVGATGLMVTSWSFHTHTGVTGKHITPMLYEFVGSNYVLRAMGETRTIGSAGIIEGLNTDIGFNLQSGSSTITNANFFFGWKDGSQTAANTGVLSYDHIGGPVTYENFWEDNLTSADIGSSLSVKAGLQRNYSIQATAESASPVPEPSTYALIAVGLLSIGILKRKRA